LNADGTLDNSFAPPLLPSDLIITSVVIDSNGKILIGGRKSSKFFCLRLNVNGSVDTSFNLTPTITQEIYKIVLLPNNAYLIMCAANESFGTFFTKINNDGSIDESFDSGNPTNFDFSFFDVAVQSDGKILIAGNFTKFSGQTANSIVRLMPNGEIDNSFSSSGPLNGGDYAYISSIALNGDRIILSGSFTSFGSQEVKNLVVLKSSGAVDTNFIYPGPTANLYPNSLSRVAFHNNGILLGGFNYESSGYVYRLLKLKTDGSVDSSFPTATFEVPSFGYVTQPQLSVSGSTILFIGLFNRSGTVERSGISVFNSNGTIKNVNPLIGGYGEIFDARLQADGKIIIGGKFTHVNGISANSLARINIDGSLDATFGKNIGKGFSDAINAIELQPDGKILAGGIFQKYNDLQKEILVRLNADGTLDTSFKPNLLAGSGNTGVNAILALPSGEIIVGGDFFTAANYNNLAKLKADGTDVTSFNRLLTRSEVITTIGLQSTNNLVIGGTDFPRGIIKRIDLNGALVNNISTAALDGWIPQVIKVLPNDNFIAGGFLTSSNGPSTPNPLLQFSKTGSLTDSNSIAVYDGGLFGLEYMDDGSILLSGMFKAVNGVSRSGLAKIKLDGNLSPNFDLSVDGFVTKLIKVNAPYNEYYSIGSFHAIDSVQAFNIIKVVDPLPAKIVINQASLTQTYDKKAKVPGVTTEPAGLKYSIEFAQNNSTVANATNAGVYNATIKIQELYYYGSELVTLTINKATATVQVKTTSLTQTYDNLAKTIEVTTTPAGLPYQAEYKQSGSPIDSAVDAGKYDVTVSIVDDNYLGFAYDTLTIKQASQTISFAVVEDQTLGGPPVLLQAVSTSRLTVSFESTSDKVTISDSRATLAKAGRATIKAAQAGNNNYLEAPLVSRSFCIRPAKPAISANFNNPEQPTLSSTNSATNQWYFNNQIINGATHENLVISEVGVYKVRAMVDDCVSEFSDEYIVVITGDVQTFSKTLRAFPNPVVDYLHIEGVSSNAIGKIYHINGAESRVSSENLNGTLTFDVESISFGLYLVKILDGGTTTTLKFLKK
jgi:uncharacterized delta-60 repeat protein